MSLMLSDEDLVELTGRQRKSSQARQLRCLGIAFRLRTDGSIVVFKRDIENAPQKAATQSPKLRLPEARRLLPGKAKQVDSARY